MAMLLLLEYFAAKYFNIFLIGAVIRQEIFPFKKLWLDNRLKLIDKSRVLGKMGKIDEAKYLQLWIEDCITGTHYT